MGEKIWLEEFEENIQTIMKGNHLTTCSDLIMAKKYSNKQENPQNQANLKAIKTRCIKNEVHRDVALQDQ